MTVHIKVLKSYISLTTHLNPKFLTIKGRQSEENKTKYFLLRQSEEFNNITHGQTDGQMDRVTPWASCWSQKKFYNYCKIFHLQVWRHSCLSLNQKTGTFKLVENGKMAAKRRHDKLKEWLDLIPSKVCSIKIINHAFSFYFTAACKIQLHVSHLMFKFAIAQNSYCFKYLEYRI